MTTNRNLLRCGEYDLNLESPQADGLVSWWPECKFDLCGGWHTEVSGGPRRTADGGLVYNGSTDYHSAGNLTGLLSTEGTFSVWVRRRLASPINGGQGGDTGFVHVGSDSAGQGSVYPWTDGIAYLGILRSLRIDGIALSSSVDRTRWHLFTVTSKPGANGWVLYQNHLTISTQTGDATVTLPSILQLGRTAASGFTSYYDGQLRDARLYRRALSQQEVAAIYKNPYDLYKPYSQQSRMVSASTNRRRRSLIAGAGR